MENGVFVVSIVLALANAAALLCVGAVALA